MNATTKFLEHDLDSKSEKIRALEETVADLQYRVSDQQEQLMALMMTIRETQKYLIKCAKNQQDLTKRVSQWPYLTISNEEES